MSWLDASVLVLGAAGSLWAVRIDTALGIAILFTVGHFFLFCNVVRMSRPRELTWAALFVFLAISTMRGNTPTWNQTFLVSLIATCVLVFFQMRSPSYHGVFWRRINPALPIWWQQHGGESPRA
jgi:hypothetical protein